ncbi:MAG TPA: type II 3-dehydroquinate dehydratase [bacterium]|nr:type II 3-dehydroquinate dehydratase [bacterium]
MRILVIHGPNLNLLGDREPEVYGTVSLAQINASLKKLAKEHKADITIMQSNHEGDIVDMIGNAKRSADAIIINPAAYTHTSVAIRDAIAASRVPAIEVHLSNIYGREDFRSKSLIAPVAAGQIAGFGAESYALAFRAALSLKGKKLEK